MLACWHAQLSPMLPHSPFTPELLAPLIIIIISLLLLLETLITDKQMRAYLMTPKNKIKQGRHGIAAAIEVDVDRLEDEFVKLLNLTHDWLHSFPPFILQKVLCGLCPGRFPAPPLL